jgi:hypothetical protein
VGTAEAVSTDPERRAPRRRGHLTVHAPRSIHETAFYVLRTGLEHSLGFREGT